MKPVEGNVFYVGDHCAEATKFFQAFPKLTLFCNNREQNILTQFLQVTPCIVVCDFDATGLDLRQFVLDVDAHRPSSDASDKLSLPAVIANNCPMDWVRSIDGTIIAGKTVYGPDFFLSGQFPDELQRDLYIAIINRIFNPAKPSSIHF